MPCTQLRAHIVLDGVPDPPGEGECQISPTQRRLLHAETGGQPGGPARRGVLQAVVRRVVVEREREDGSRVELAV